MIILQAIETKFYGPTNYRGARIKAECAAKSLWYEWNYELSVDENHRQAAKFLQRSLNWKGPIKSGQLKKGSYVHVQEFRK